MKNIRKEQLKFDKEVIADLSNEHLAGILGGAGPNTFASNCICVTVDQETCVGYTKGINCQVNVSKNSQGEVCCVLPGDSKAGGICVLPPDTYKTVQNCIQLSENGTCLCDLFGK